MVKETEGEQCTNPGRFCNCQERWVGTTTKDFLKSKLTKARVNSRNESQIESKDQAWNRSRLAAKQVIISKKGEFDRLHSGRKKEIQRRRRTGQISDL